MKYLKQILPNLLVLFILLIPILSNAQTTPPDSGLVPCTDGKACNFNMLMKLVDNVIKFVLFQMVVPIAAIMFFYAGLLMVTSGGESAEAKTKAKSIFLNTILGLCIALAAWLIISTLLAILGYEGSWIGLYIEL